MFVQQPPTTAQRSVESTIAKDYSDHTRETDEEIKRDRHRQNKINKEKLGEHMCGEW